MLTPCAAGATVTLQEDRFLCALQEVCYWLPRRCWRLRAWVSHLGRAEQGTAEDRLAAVGFNATGLPVVDQQITVRAMISRPGHIPVPYDTMTLLIDLQEMTNIDIEFEELPAAQANERVNLMFASREFPDVFFDVGLGGNDALIYDAALGGDVWQLDPLIERYAPNWKRAFEEDERLRLRIAYPGRAHLLAAVYAQHRP